MDTMVGYLVKIDGGRHAASEYESLLTILHDRFPNQSYTSLGDMGTKAKELCAAQGKAVEVITPLYALKNITDGYDEAEFAQMFANNPPPTLLALWIGTGCE